MARVLAATLPAVLTATVTSFVNGLPGPPKTKIFTGSGTASGSTRGDIVRTPPGAAFRKPLAYSATGWSRSSAAMSVQVDTFTNAGNTRVRTNASGTIGTFNAAALLSPPLIEQLISPSDRERLLVDLLKNVGDQKWSMGQAIVEGREAITMIGGAARTLSKAMFAATRKDWRGLARALNVKPGKAGKHADDTSSGWLAYSFGWVPLVEDITSAALFLGGLLDDEKLLIMARGSMSKSRTETVPGAFTQATGGAVITTSWKEKRTRKSDLKMSLYYSVTTSQLYELSRYGIIGASTPWAVMPMSFLVDWVLPIGDFLAALDATIGLKYQGGSYTHFDRSTASRKRSSITAGAGVVLPGSEVLWSPVERFDMVRTVYPSNPIPVPLYVKNPFSVWKTVTSIALLRQFKS